MNSKHILPRHVRDSTRNGKFRDTMNDKFAAVHSNIFRVLGARGIEDYLDRRVPEGSVPLPLHIHKSFADRAAESLSPWDNISPPPFLSFLFSILFKTRLRPFECSFSIYRFSYSYFPSISSGTVWNSSK